MAKKKNGFLKLLIVGAAAAGAYYYLKKKDSEIPANMDEDEDFDNFDEDVDDGPTSKSSVKRNYVSLDFNTVEQKAKDAAVKVAETAEKAASQISEKLQTAAGKVEEFFDDRNKPIDVDVEYENEVESEADEDSADDYIEANE